MLEHAGTTLPLQEHMRYGKEVGDQKQGFPMSANTKKITTFNRKNKHKDKSKLKLCQDMTM